ncbi:phage replisome organizer N-terminal domain-containing protein [Paenibacillus farraposensis]|uniref:Phage replisome organizer N-terminal domain-containing protein n=2 Tax=Paenibacillus farraposensis TaxID=2807095 RepID=A0ABW4DDN1_9BACL|nr:phage replisome organizer N-terminal domain-containing protein [Paenibacillus farraposensis]MCC3380729.1 phage replisome organizer N-terminal domain-containing protein [Paenibacillus farraposensis]
MAEIKWIKLSTGMFDDEKIKIIEDMPEADTIIVIWLKLMTMTGRSNMGGYIMLTETIPYTEDMLISVIKRPLPVIKMALSIFERFGMLEVSEQGAFFLPNWEKHQNVDGMDKVREQTKKRVRNYRNKQKQLDSGENDPHVTGNATSNVTVTGGNETDRELDLEQEKESSCCLTPEAEIKSEDEGIPSSRQGAVPATPETDTDSGQDEISSAEVDYRNAVANKYLQRRGKGLEISMADDLTISELQADGISLSTALDGVDQAFDNFKPQYKRHEIGSMRYCAKVIYALHESRSATTEQDGTEEQKPVEDIDPQPDEQYTEDDLQKMLAELRQKQGG